MNVRIFVWLVFVFLLFSCGNHTETAYAVSRTDSVSTSQDTVADNLYSKKKLIGRDHFILLPDSIRTLLNQLGFCQQDTLQKYTAADTVYNYCDACCFEIIPLHRDWEKMFLLQIRYNGTGSGGNHYYVLKQDKNQYEQVNFFQGYVDTVTYNKPYYDIVFNNHSLFYMPELYRQNYKLRLSWHGAGYAFKKLLSVHNYYAENDCLVYVTRYNPELNSPAYWKYLGEKPGRDF